MNLKYNMLATALAVACGALALAPTAQAADGTITFTGKVLNSTCSITNGTSGSFTVALPDVQASAFTGAATATGTTPFEIDMTNCPTTPSGVVVAAQFSGTQIDTTSGALINTGSSNVEVQLTDESGATGINLNTNTPLVTDTIANDGTAALKYQARYYQPTATTITAGTVSTSVDYTLTYN